MRTLHKLTTLWVFTGFCRKILSGKRPSRYSFNHFALLLLVLLSEWKGDGPLHFKGYMQVLCCYDVHDTFRILQLYENQSWINSKNNNYACHKKSMIVIKVSLLCMSLFLFTGKFSIYILFSTQYSLHIFTTHNYVRAQYTFWYEKTNWSRVHLK